MDNPNTSVLDAINDLAGKSSFLDSLGKFAAQDLVYVIIALGAVLLVWLLVQRIRFAFEVAIILVIAVGLSLVIGRGIQHLWFEARPWVDHPDTVKLISHSADASFPSDHCLVAGAIAAVVLLASRVAGIIAIVLAVLIAWGRVFVGVHYPGDVLAGLAIGAACGVVTWFIVRGVLRRLSPTSGLGLIRR